MTPIPDRSRWTPRGDALLVGAFRRGIVRDVLLPRTDALVVAETVLVVVVSVLALAAVRHDRDLRLAVLGLVVLVFAFVGIAGGALKGGVSRPGGRVCYERHGIPDSPTTGCRHARV